MGLFQRNICPKCGEEYSAFRPACPNCGARRLKASERTVAGTDTVRQGTVAQRRQASNSHWQLIFGLCLVAAVIIAVIVLIATTLNGEYSTYPTPTPSEDVSPSPTLEPTPSPTPTPTPTVESVVMTYYGTPSSGFTIFHLGDTVQLEAQVYPIDIQGGVSWESADETICTVSEDGLVTGVGPGQTSLIVRCYGAASEIPVVVKDN